MYNGKYNKSSNSRKRYEPEDEAQQHEDARNYSTYSAEDTNYLASYPEYHQQQQDEQDDLRSVMADLGHGITEDSEIHYYSNEESDPQVYSHYPQHAYDEDEYPTPPPRQQMTRRSGTSRKLPSPSFRQTIAPPQRSRNSHGGRREQHHYNEEPDEDHYAEEEEIPRPHPQPSGSASRMLKKNIYQPPPQPVVEETEEPLESPPPYQKRPVSAYPSRGSREKESQLQSLIEENNMLKAKIYEIEVKYGEMRVDMEEFFKEEVQNLKGELEQKETEITQKNAQVTDLQAKLQKLEQEAAQSNTKVQELQKVTSKESSNIAEELVDLKSRCQSQEQELKNLTASNAKKDDIISKIQTEVHGLNKKIQGLEVELQNKNSKIADLEEQNAERESNFKEADTKLRKQQEEFRAVAQQLTNAKNEIAKLKEALAKEEANRNDLNFKNVQLNTEMRDLLNKDKGTQMTMRQLQLENENFAKELANARRFLEQMDKDKKQLEQQFISVKDQYSEQVNTHQQRMMKEIDALMKENMMLKASMPSYEQEIQNQRQTISSLTNKVQQLQQQLQSASMSSVPSYHPSISTSAPTFSLPTRSISPPTTKPSFSSLNMPEVGNSQEYAMFKRMMEMFGNAPSTTSSLTIDTALPKMPDLNHYTEYPSSSMGLPVSDSVPSYSSYSSQPLSPKSNHHPSVYPQNNNKEGDERIKNRQKMMQSNITNAAPSQSDRQSTPFATEQTLRDSIQATAQTEKQLMEFQLEKTTLESEYQKLLAGGLKSIANRKRKIEIEQRLEVVNKESSRLKLKLRDMNLLK